MTYRQSINLLIFTALLSLPIYSVHAIGWYGNDLNNNACTGNSQSFGPYDYLLATSKNNTAYYQKSRIWEIDRIHYEKGMNLWKNKGLHASSINYIWNEFDYTLRAFPNHTKALHSIIKLELERLATNKIKEQRKFRGLKTPPECYLQRAMHFRPKQQLLPLLYGLYLHKLKRYEQAETQYKKAISLNINNAETHYNLGLLSISLKKYDQAKTHAKKAYALGYPLLGLKKKLIKVNHWDTTTKD